MNSEKPLSSGFQFAPDGWARAVLVLIWALRALIVFIAQSLHKLKSAYAFIYSQKNRTLIQNNFINARPKLWKKFLNYCDRTPGFL